MVKRNTIQKSLVKGAVSALANHPKADDVYIYIRANYPGISKATVYRNLNSLADDGELLRIQMPNTADRYDHNVHHHYHLSCNLCGAFSDIDMPYMSRLDKQAEKISGYKLENHSIVFKGICPKCRID